MPVVIVTHEAEMDLQSLMELGAQRNEYVTRISDYEQLQDLLDYLLPALHAPPAQELLSNLSNPCISKLVQCPTGIR